TSKSRNKLIAKAFKEIGLIERYGSGIHRIQNICKDYGVVSPVFEEIADGFRVVLFNEKLEVAEKDDGVNDGVNDLFILISENPGINTKTLTEKMNISKRTI